MSPSTTFAIGVVLGILGYGAAIWAVFRGSGGASDG